MMQDQFKRDPFGYARTRVFQLKRWQLVLISAAVLAFILTLVVIAASAFLILFPVILIVGLVMGLISRWRSKRAGWPADTDKKSATRTTDPIIDAEYVILTDKRRDEKP